MRPFAFFSYLYGNCVPIDGPGVHGEPSYGIPGAHGDRQKTEPDARDQRQGHLRLRYDEQSVGAGNKKPGPWNARHGDRPKTRTTGQ